MNNSAESEETREVSSWRIPEWFPEVSEEKLEQLEKYHQELKRFNSKINLVSPRTMARADLIHFSDSIKACQMIAEASSFNKVFDIGSGNGFPGLVMAILFPELEVVAVDRDQRKMEFIKHMTSRIKIQNMNCTVDSIENLPEKSIEVALSRGFAPLQRSLILTRNVFKENARYFHLKGDEWVREIASLPSQVCSFWRPSMVGEYQLPIEGVRRVVIKTVKFAD